MSNRFGSKGFLYDYEPDQPMTTKHPGSKPPKNRKRGFLTFINRFFDFIKVVIEIVFNIIKNFFILLTFLFKNLVELLAHPTMPSVVAITFFAIFVGIAAFQWFEIGKWLFTIFGLKGFWGIGGGLFGLLLGFGINIYQLAPELWKLQPKVAKAYDDLNINPDAELEKPELKEKLKHWLTYDHGTLKGMRMMSYGLETSLVLGYVALAGGFEFWSIFVAGASLLMPEWTLKGVAATTGVTQAVNDRVSQMQDDEDEMKKFGFE